MKSFLIFLIITLSCNSKPQIPESDLVNILEQVSNDIITYKPDNHYMVKLLENSYEDMRLNFTEAFEIQKITRSQIDQIKIKNETASNDTLTIKLSDLYLYNNDIYIYGEYFKLKNAILSEERMRYIFSKKNNSEWKLVKKSYVSVSN